YGGRIAEVRLSKWEVIAIEPQLEPYPLANLPPLSQRQLGPVHARPLESIAPQAAYSERRRIAESIVLQVGILRRRREAVRPQTPPGDVSIFHRPDNIRPRFSGQIPVRAAGVRHRERLAGLQRLRPGQLPAAEHMVHDSAAVQQTPAFADREVV